MKRFVTGVGLVLGGLSIVIVWNDPKELIGLSLLWALIGVFWVYPAICLERIAIKTNTEAEWLAWLPIGNIYLTCLITQSPGWFTPFCLIPFVGIIPAFLLLWRLPGALNVHDASRIYILIPVLNYFYLGYLAFRKEQDPTVPPPLPPDP